MGCPWGLQCSSRREESMVATFLQSKQGFLLWDPTQGTRWTSDRCIDWGWCSNQNFLVFSRVNQRVHISDHKGQVFQLYEAASAVKRGRLKPGPKWTRPTWLSPEEWM